MKDKMQRNPICCFSFRNSFADKCYSVKNYNKWRETSKKFVQLLPFAQHTSAVAALCQLFKKIKYKSSNSGQVL